MIEQSGQLAAHLAAFEDDDNVSAKPLNLHVHVRWLIAAMFAWLTRNLRRIVPPSPPPHAQLAAACGALGLPPPPPTKRRAKTARLAGARRVAEAGARFRDGVLAASRHRATVAALDLGLASARAAPHLGALPLTRAARAAGDARGYVAARRRRDDVAAAVAAAARALAPLGGGGVDGPAAWDVRGADLARRWSAAVVAAAVAALEGAGGAAAAADGVDAAAAWLEAALDRPAAAAPTPLARVRERFELVVAALRAVEDGERADVAGAARAAAAATRALDGLLPAPAPAPVRAAPAAPEEPAVYGTDDADAADDADDARAAGDATPATLEVYAARGARAPEPRRPPRGGGGDLARDADAGRDVVAELRAALRARGGGADDEGDDDRGAPPPVVALDAATDPRFAVVFADLARKLEAS